jgi:hypothetical protein
MVKRKPIRNVCMVQSAIAAVVLLTMASCGIFSPRDSEAPVDKGRVDPLNFAAILDGASQHFTNLRYEDLFLDGDSTYYDFNSGRFSKTSLIQKLQQIVTGDSLIKVQWFAGDIWTSAGNDTMILTGFKYYIFSNGSTGGTPADSGATNFTVVYNRFWLISRWTDMPLRLGKSFFSPY